MFRHMLRLLRWAWLVPLAAAVLVDLDSLVSVDGPAGRRAAVIAAWLFGVVAAVVTVQVTSSSPRPLFDRSRSGLQHPLTPIALTVIGVSALLPWLLDGAATPTVSALYTGLVLTGVLTSRALDATDLVMAAVAGVIVVVPFALQGPGGDPALVSATVTATVIAAALGLLVREQHRRVAIASDAAVQGERMAMAAELHDSVAHELTGILVLARANLRPAAAAGDTDDHAVSDRTQQALELIVESSQRALDEIRDLVRTIDPTGSTAPDDTDGSESSVGTSDGHRRLVSLVETFDAGSTATVEVDIEDLRLTPSEWLALQRVCAEALTNIRRHAGSAARITVRLDQVDGLVRLEITDDGGGGGLGRGSGTGIRGARGRIEALGGRLQAAPTGAGGWSLLAELPHRQPASSGDGDDARTGRDDR